MPIFALFPIVIIGIVIAAVRSAAEQKKRQEIQRRAQEAQREEAVSEGQANYNPVKPSVQVPVRRAEPAPRPAPTVQKAYQSPLANAQKPAQQMHPGHDFCALRPDDPKAKDPKKHPEHDLCALRPDAGQPHGTVQTAGSPLNLTPDAILNGVIFSEIFGKPKALR
ncbi:MAG: hypothetical protein IJL62_08975 [Clostridia bacterium]|nr:hypothetical protein [Clostridia bacterium]